MSAKASASTVTVCWRRPNTIFTPLTCRVSRTSGRGGAVARALGSDVRMEHLSRQFRCTTQGRVRAGTRKGQMECAGCDWHDLAPVKVLLMPGHSSSCSYWLRAVNSVLKRCGIDGDGAQWNSSTKLYRILVEKIFLWQCDPKRTELMCRALLSSKDGLSADLVLIDAQATPLA